MCANSAETDLLFNNEEVNSEEVGIRYFAAKNYAKALEYFSKALVETATAKDSQRLREILANRSATFLALGRPKSALGDAENGLKIDPKNERLLLQKAIALKQLGKFEECVNFIEERKNVPFPSDLLLKAKRALSESKFGHFDLKEILEESGKSPELAGHGNFFAHELIEVREVHGFGYGLVAKKDIAPGQLLIAEKALAFRPSPRHNSVASIPNGSCNFGLEELVQPIFERLSNDSDLRCAFFHLRAAPGFSQNKNTTEVGNNVIDVERVKAIIRANYFLVKEHSSNCVYSGVWLYPSYINHSCVDTNCTRLFLGGLMFVRASRKINPGEHLLFRYCTCLEKFEYRIAELSLRGFICNCRLCMADRTQSIEDREKMASIIKRQDELAKNRASNNGKNAIEYIAAAERLLVEARLLRSDLSINQFALKLCGVLATWCKENGNHCRAIQLLEERCQAYESAGMTERAVIGYANLWMCFSTKVSKRKMGRWEKKVRYLADIWPCNDDLFLAYLKSNLVI